MSWHWLYRADSAFAYHEPSISTTLNQTGLLLVLNLVNTCLDKLLYCGLIGQLFVGIFWGTPGAKWLDRGVETVIQQLGYLDLIMLVANMYLSVAVAFTGIGIPMALSILLLVRLLARRAWALPFTILSTTGLIITRLGTVTTSVAMLDDVVGLVMVLIISNLGGSGNSFSALTVVRPLFVSPGFGVGVVLACRLLVGLVAGATYAGTSSLFAAYLAGVISSWFDGLLQAMPVSTAESSSFRQEASPQPASSDSGVTHSHRSPEPGQEREQITGMHIYEHYYQGPASIGFAIPITEMFQGRVVWRGFVYALLMTFGKMCTGLWLVRGCPLSGLTTFARILKASLSYVTSCLRRPPKSQSEKSTNAQRAEHREPSLYPASILSLAMVARGEIGYLIASLAESNGIFGTNSQGSSETYLVVVWAISLCTLIGPISVRTLVKRVKTLQRQRENSNTGGADPLGVWGI
ncbi:uncharacterized protein BDW70DRAFT_150926 [Aspergillus foveolatus]|uniref:uncharacterized protein n=1 Tax=Aspergillus foveolatus TaxID=210207 RepID=UPI003CCDA35B